ncbi:MAG: AI-2E family transporter [Candidatus Latescibacteria bacterium]|nr:AI-2E family transporter [Candidatus Latescibacterota bacterium]
MNETADQREPEDQPVTGQEQPGPVRARRRRRRRGGGGSEGQPAGSALARPQPSGVLPVLPLIAGGVLLCVLLYTIRAALAPPVLGLLALYLLYPYRQNRLVARVMAAAGLLLLVWVVAAAGQTLFPVVFAFVLAYLFNPVVTRLERWGVPRGVAVLLLLAALVGLIVAAGVFVAPVVLGQLTGLIRQLPKATDRLITWVEGPVLGAVAGTFGLGSAGELEARLLQGLADEWQGVVQQGLKTAVRLISGFATVLGALSRMLELIAIPFVTFYLLKDFGAFQTHVKSLIPIRYLGSAVQTVHEVDDVISRYIRGQLLVCLIVGVLNGTALAIAGLDYALILGIVTGTLNIIPYFGFIISLGVAVLVALFNPAPVLMILKVLAIYLGLNILEGSVISPRIVGHQVGLHPVWVIVGMLIFFHFFGFIGLLIAVPATAVIRLFVGRWYRRYLGSAAYNRL